MVGVGWDWLGLVGPAVSAFRAVVTATAATAPNCFISIVYIHAPNQNVTLRTNNNTKAKGYS